MTNTFAISNVVATTAAEILKASLVLGRTVFRSAETDYEGGRGDTIRIRVPKAIPAKPFRGSVDDIVQTVDEGEVPLTLSTHAVSAVDLSPKDYSLNVADATIQAIAPTVIGVSEYIEQAIGIELQKKIDTATLEIEPTNPRDAITTAGAMLDKARVGNATRWLVVDPDIKKMLLDDPNLSQVADAGDDSALRDALIGRLHGFTVVMSPFIKGAIAMSGDAFACAVRAPRVPDGVSGKSQSDTDDQGYAITVLHAFNDNRLTQRIISQAFVGTAVIDDVRSVGLKLKASA